MGRKTGNSLQETFVVCGDDNMDEDDHESNFYFINSNDITMVESNKFDRNVHLNATVTDVDHSKLCRMSDEHLSPPLTSTDDDYFSPTKSTNSIEHPPTSSNQQLPQPHLGTVFACNMRKEIHLSKRFGRPL